MISRNRPRGSARGLLLALTTALTLGSAPAGAQVEPSVPVAFVGVSVVPMDSERVLENQTVLVRDGRIAEIGPADRVAVPAGATVVEGRGRWLLPGLTEMHAHIPSPQAGPDVLERTLFLYLAGGVTTVRGMLGHPDHLRLREQAAAGEILAPRVYTSGPSFNGTSVESPEGAAAMVEAQKAAGYDLLKLHPGLTRDEFDAIDAAADRVGVPYAGHVSAAVGLRRALEAGYATIDHLDGYLEALAGFEEGFTPEQSGFFGLALADAADPARVPALVEATRAAAVANVPTQSLLEHLASAEPTDSLARRPEMRYMPPQTLEQWARQTEQLRGQPGFTRERAERFLALRRALLLALHEGGATLLLGSDAPQIWNVPGFAIRRELQYLVDAGLTPYEALATGTRAAAAHFGAEREWGTIAPGRAADLILLEGDPLRDVGNLWRQAGVMVRGRWLPQDEIERRLERIAASVSGGA